MALSTETFESAYGAAREQVAPRLRLAHGAVMPAVAAAQRRASGVVRAARGEPVGPEPRRWPAAVGWFLAGAAVGAATLAAVRRGAAEGAGTGDWEPGWSGESAAREEPAVRVTGSSTFASDGAGVPARA